VFDLGGSATSGRLSNCEVDQLARLAAPVDDRIYADRDALLQQLQESLDDDDECVHDTSTRHERTRTRERERVVDDESAFDGVTSRQLEQMRLLQVCRTPCADCFGRMLAWWRLAQAPTATTIWASVFTNERALACDPFPLRPIGTLAIPPCVRHEHFHGVCSVVKAATRTASTIFGNKFAVVFLCTCVDDMFCGACARLNLLQVRQHLLLMEERQLADIACCDGPPLPPAYAACALPPVAYVGKSGEGCAEGATLPGYLPAPREFADSDDDADNVDNNNDDDDDDGEDTHDDDDDDDDDDDGDDNDNDGNDNDEIYDDDDDDDIDVDADLADMFSRRV
jgi:hypothetical protein